MDQETLRAAIADLTEAISRCNEASQSATRARGRLQDLAQRAVSPGRPAAPFLGAARPASPPPARPASPSSSPRKPGAVITKFFWDVEDEGIAPLAVEAMRSAFPQKEFTRYTTTTPRLPPDSVLFGFLGIFGRADIGQENLTKLWASTRRSVVVVARGPGVPKAPSTWERPADWAGRKEEKIHFYADLNGTRTIIEGNFRSVAGFSTVGLEWDSESLKYVANQMRNAVMAAAM